MIEIGGIVYDIDWCDDPRTGVLFEVTGYEELSTGVTYTDGYMLRIVMLPSDLEWAPFRCAKLADDIGPRYPSTVKRLPELIWLARIANGEAHLDPKSRPQAS